MVLVANDFHLLTTPEELDGTAFKRVKCPAYSGRSAAWLAYLHGVQVVGGSNPLVPTRLFTGNRIAVSLFLYLKHSSKG